jgi:hypothetical protein
MLPRSTGFVDVKDYVESGDMFGIIRLDGLDPLLAYLMGSQTGHTGNCVIDFSLNCFVFFESFNRFGYLFGFNSRLFVFFSLLLFLVNGLLICVYSLISLFFGFNSF